MEPAVTTAAVPIKDHPDLEGLPPPEIAVAAGLAEGLALAASALSLADCHLAPMIAAFAAADEGAALPSGFPS
jgi:hypothetical protein